MAAVPSLNPLSYADSGAPKQERILGGGRVGVGQRTQPGQGGRLLSKGSQVDAADRVQALSCSSLPRTCLEALKGLFWTNEYWEVFADVKLIQGWELFAHLETFPKGVTLLAR